jgi:hypothetical protein
MGRLGQPGTPLCANARMDEPAASAAVPATSRRRVSIAILPERLFSVHC